MLSVLLLLLLLSCVRNIDCSCTNDTYTEISVRNNGSNSANCHECLSLQYVLSSLKLTNCTKVSVYNNQTISSKLIVSNISDLIIEGFGSINVTCVTNNNNSATGFEFINTTDVDMIGILWINCGIIGPHNLLSNIYLYQSTLKTTAVQSLPSCTTTAAGNTSSLEFKFWSASTNTSCSSYNSDCILSVMLGERLYVQLAPNNSTVNQVAVYVNVTCDTSEIACNDLTYHIDPLNTFGITTQRTQVPFHLKGDEILQDQLRILNWEVLSDDISSGHFLLNITKCKTGYIYNNESKTCVCYDKEDKIILCNDKDYTACVKAGYWYGQLHAKHENTSVSYPCPFGNCDYSIGGECPNRDLAHMCEVGYCLLESEKDNSLCLYNRGGPLCSSCAPGFSFSFETLRCVDSSSCSNWFFAVYVLITLIFWLIITVVMFFVAKVDLRIGSGKLYCLIFYFSVLQYFVRGEFPSTTLYVIELIFTGFMELKPIMFGYIGLCVEADLDTFHYAIYHYINPLFLMTLISVLAYVSWKWPRYAIFGNSNNGVNLICIIIYIVFISLTQTSLEVLTPVYFPGSYNNTAFTLLKPDATFFNNEHLPYAIIALLTQIFLVIPFLFLLLFAPYLMPIGFLNLTRIKPLLDEYQACYKDRYRSFAGYYLTCRQLIFILNLLIADRTVYIYMLQIISILSLAFHCLIQPYKEQLLNFIDGFLLLDLVLLSILHGTTANVVFANIKELDEALVHILVLLPVLLFVVMCIIQLLRLVFKRIRFFKKFLKKFEHDPDSRGIIRKPNGVFDSDANRDEEEQLEREPLLFEDNNGYNSYNTASQTPLLSSSDIIQSPKTVSVVHISS